ncbi:DoxX membrane protein [Rickettsiales bacterium Ac37b]|nr:DoxX membrane protein [Rickettsiales bacterium Ac37b]
MFLHDTNKLSSMLIRSGLLILVCCVLHAIFIDKKIPDYAAFFSLFFILLAFLVHYFVIPKDFTIGYLISCFAFLIMWRISAMHSVTTVSIPSIFIFIAFLCQIADYIYNDLKYPSEGYLVKIWHNKLLWQMTLLRMYFGFDMVGHFTEKLFAGRASYYHLINVFIQLGVTFNTDLIVLLAGLCELAIAIGIGLGIITRLAALGAALYFLIATILGHHFLDGFTWVNPGGGWEYPMLMIVFYVSFILAGAGKFSVDSYMVRKKLIPKILYPYCK